MQQVQVDINAVVNNLVKQIAEKTAKIAVLEATIDALNQYIDDIENAVDGQDQ